MNRLMAAEFDHHLSQERAENGAAGGKNRDGATRKPVLTDDSAGEVSIPRDREARFDPVLIGKYQRRLPGFDNKVISLYARGMSTREIQGRSLQRFHVRSTWKAGGGTWRSYMASRSRRN